MSTIRRSLPVSPARAWALTAAAVVLGVGAGAVVSPRLVYDRFLWRHFVGRVVVDANNAVCAVRTGGTTRFVDEQAACSELVAAGRLVADNQYTLLSEIGYGATLVFCLAGIVIMLRRYDIGRYRQLLYALVPFMVFGSALRVIEDADNAAPEGVTAFLTYPANVIVVSPIIYFTGAALALATIVGAVGLERRGYVDRYVDAVAVVGTVLFVLATGYLGYLAVTTTFVDFKPLFVGVTLVVATAATAVVYGALRRYRPAWLAGTGLIAVVVLWAHALDGAANMLAADWAIPLGLSTAYVPKHPVNAAIYDVTAFLLPASIEAVTGDAWGFLVVKVAVAALVVSVFDERIFEESPRYAILLLIAIVLVGLGPGARDVMRAGFGV